MIAPTAARQLTLHVLRLRCSVLFLGFARPDVCAQACKSKRSVNHVYKVGSETSTLRNAGETGCKSIYSKLPQIRQAVEKEREMSMNSIKESAQARTAQEM